jgi:hypothetical protein
MSIDKAEDLKEGGGYFNNPLSSTVNKYRWDKSIFRTIAAQTMAEEFERMFKYAYSPLDQNDDVSIYSRYDFLKENLQAIVQEITCAAIDIFIADKPDA